jgi:beta-phosphoglucomutase-like phosphatase (HAD superfamily)
MVFEDALYALKTAKAAGFVTVGVYDKSSSDNRKRLRTLVIFI